MNLRLLLAALTAVILILTADHQIYDSNLYAMSAATALLAGDHPYRDFFETGVPLASYLSAGAQLLVGHRLIGEFLLHWLFIVAGVLIAFELARRVSRSTRAALATLALVVILLAATPTYHHSKLFVFPITIWLAWRYMDQPGVRRSCVLGVAAAVAFLFRHDYGVYVGFACVAALALARLAAPVSRSVPSLIREGVALGAATVLALAPWLVVVQTSEGLAEYVRLRADLYEGDAVRGSPYQWLRGMNPVQALMPDALPSPRPGRASIEWAASVDPATRDRLEHAYGLRVRDGSTSNRRHYEIANMYDGRLAELEPFVHESEGVDWPLLLASRSWLSGRKNAELWLCQLTLVVPLLALAAAGLDVSKRWRSAASIEAASTETASIEAGAYRIILAAALAIVVEQSLLREHSYFLVATPITAVLGARLLAGSRHLAVRAIAAGVLLITAVATLGYVRHTGIFDPGGRLRSLPGTFDQLLASPPIDGYQPADAALRTDRASWSDGSADKGKIITRYLHDCTRPGDRILVSGSTPFHIAYYANKPIAGGHVFWHRGWRSDAIHERQLLALLQTQSVPFAFSTHDPVLEDLKRYPSIRDYFVTHYVELEGSHGVLLIDTRRPPTRRFGLLGFPCFD